MTQELHEGSLEIVASHNADDSNWYIEKGLSLFFAGFASCVVL